MTPAFSDDRAGTAPDRQQTAHDKAVEMVMGDRDMVSLLLREHQMLHEAFEHAPAALVLRDAQGAPLLSNTRHDRLKADDAADYRIETVTLPGGKTLRLAVHMGAEKARLAALGRARDGAEAANRAKDDFLASMSHEIRTPMNGLMGMAGLLAESGLTKGQKDYADVILRSGRALLAITDDILDLSKIEAGGMILDLAPFDIADTIEETATLFAANADAKGIDLIVRVDPSLPRLLVGDGNRLRQIVANLVGNAVKFTDSGHVMVDLDGVTGIRDAAGTRVARLTCHVQDTGKGIAPEMCGRIFERFSQAERAAHRAQEGTGLGLAIVAALVEEMGGTVGVESIEGEGTTFHFTVELPVAGQGAPRGTREDLRGRRVMIIDGEAPRRAIVAESARAWGFEIASCRGTREGMALMDAMEARNRGIDLVLLGERVAEGAAPLFMKALAERAGPPPPVILLARFAGLTICDGYGEIAPVDALSRPVRSADLLAGMERALDARPAPSVAQAGPVAAPPPGPSPDTALMQTLLPRPAPVLRIEGPAGEARKARLDILVAEDNEINRFLIEEILRESGYSYRIVRDGIEAVEAWRADRPRLILMDLSMPGMSGDEATRVIRSEEYGAARTPVVALTAHALHGDHDRCIEAGMDDHLPKPVTVASIMRMVDCHLHPAMADAAG